MANNVIRGAGRLYKYCIVVTILLSSSGAYGLEVIQKSVSKYLDQQCHQDLEKYCAGIEPGQNRIATCLSAYKYKLSPVCNDALASIGKRMQVSQAAMQQAVIGCRTDIPKYCPDLQPGRANVLNCFSKLKSPLSQTCSTTLKQFRATLKH